MGVPLLGPQNPILITKAPIVFTKIRLDDLRCDFYAGFNAGCTFDYRTSLAEVSRIGDTEE